MWTPVQAAPVGGAFQFTLPDGMRVVVLPDRHASSVTEAIWFKVGASDDPPGLSGMAHFVERLMVHDTKDAPAQQKSQMVAPTADAISSTTQDYTCFVEQVSKDRVKAAMSAQANRMLNPGISDDSVESARRDVLDERAHIDGDPSAVLDEQLAAALYLSHPYGRPVVGWPDEAKRIGRVDVSDFFDGRYTPNNAILLVAGDVTRDQVRSDAEAAFVAVSAGTPVPRFEFAQVPRLGAAHIVIESKLVRTIRLARFYRVASYGDAAPGQAEAFEVLAELLGGGASSALSRTLVAERKLATKAESSYQGTSRDAGVFSIHAVARNGVSQEKLEKAIDDVIGRLASSEPKPRDLARAKGVIASVEARRRSIPATLATIYGDALAIGLTTHDVEAWPRRIESVTGSDVMNAARSGLMAQQAVTGSLVPEAPK